MKGGTSLRPEAVNRDWAEGLSANRPMARFLNVASGIDICYLTRKSAN
jgi:hypothetical protein